MSLPLCHCSCYVPYMSRISLPTPQRAINVLTQEKSELEERFVDTQTRLQDAEEMAKKYTHLQVRNIIHF